MLLIVDGLLKEVDGGGALVFGGEEFFDEVGEGGEGGGLVAERGGILCVVKFTAHALKELAE